MKEITLIVKAPNKSRVLDYCISRRIPVNAVIAELATEQFIVHCPISHLEQALEWFGEEPIRPPFHYGTLLWFAVVDAGRDGS